jgi:DNA-binding winged helix-turn-helix (wHTH) protein/TolB-like protein/Tfp pilus assembly protein PilF
MPLKSGHLYEFGSFVLNTSSHLLTRDGNAVSLTPKTYDLILQFVQNPGRLLLKDELMKGLWPNSYVEESNLTQQISAARKALGDIAGEYRYIVTVPGKGYRFATDVKCITAEFEPVIEAAVAPSPAAEERKTPGASRTRAFWIAGIVAFMACAGYYMLRRATNLHPRSLAILPFHSLKGDAENDFLGFSLADAIITKLGVVRSLTVRPSSAVERYRHQAADFQRAAAELHVDTLLTGNYLRDGNDLRITSQLIDVKTQSILWKGAFDLKYDRILTVQDSVAHEIVKGLQLSLSPGEVEGLRPQKPVDPLAYEYYLRGVDLYSRNEFALAIKMLRQSAQVDPGYSLTWAHLGRALTASASFELGGRDQYREAMAAYEKALSLKPAPIEASIYLANLFTDTGQVERAVPLLREALQTNTNDAEVHWELGYAYRFAGMLTESVKECERARELDPGVKLNSSALNAYLYLGQYDRFLESLPRDTESPLILFYRAFGEYHKRNFAESARRFDSVFELHPSLLQVRIGKALSHGIHHEDQKGIEFLQDTEAKVATRGVGDPEALYKLGQGYAVLGDKQAALRVLRSSIEGGFFSFPYLQTDPLLASLRDEKELHRLLTVARQRHQAFKQKFF